jgi:hypothetical protein
MTKEEAIKTLKGKLNCMKLEMRGSFDCMQHHCVNCLYHYEKGDMNKQIEALDIVIKSVEREHCEDRVTCKCCRHRINGFCPMIDLQTSDDFYCGYGEMCV